MNRRRYLAVCATGATCGLAGCSSLFNDISGSSDGSSQPTIVEGPAQFTDFRIEIPSETTVDTTIPVTISAFNYGTQSGSFRGSLTTTEGASTVSKWVDLNGVESGKRGETTVDLSFSVADEYVLAVSDTPPEQTSTGGYGTTPTQPENVKAKSRVTIGPKTAAVGESFDLASPLRVTLTDVTYQQGLYYKYSSGYNEKTTDLFSTTSGKTLALLHFDVENTGTEYASFGPESFTVSDGTLYTDLRGASLSTAIDIKGNPFTNTTVQAGQRISGWFLAQLSKKRAKAGAVVGWQRDAHKTMPERRWNVKPAKLPSFSLEQWKLDTKQTIGEYSNTITVKNTGSTNGTFRGIVDYKIADEGQNAWSPFEKISATLSPGKNKTFTLKKTWTYTETLDYRVRPFGTTKTVEFQPPKLSFGETARVPGGTISVSDFQTHPTYTIDGGIGGPETYKPDDGAMFAFAYVEFIPNSDDSELPHDDDFSLRVRSETYPESGGLPGPIASPIKGQFYSYDYGDAQSGKPWGGWVSFDVPANVSASNATVVFSEEYNNGLTSGAEWSQR
jgi:hypothetical protein